MDRAEACKHAIVELQQHVSQLNEKPTDSGSILGALHRGWIDIKSILTERDSHAILVECERGEDVAKETYAKALVADLPDKIRIGVQKQYDAVKKNHQRS